MLPVMIKFVLNMNLIYRIEYECIVQKVETLSELYFTFSYILTG